VNGPDLELELPYPPSVNHYRNRYGRRTPQGKTYLNRCVAALWEFRAMCCADLFWFDQGRLELEVDHWWPARRTEPDVDNGNKVLLDTLQAMGLISNDRQIWRLVNVKRGPDTPGKVRIRLRPYVT